MRRISFRLARVSTLLAGVLLFLGITLPATAETPGSKPASATFRDSTGSPTPPPDRIASDGLSGGTYDDQVDCVHSYVSGTQYFLRTVSQNCTAMPARAITLDFSDAVTPPSKCIVSDANSGQTLNACGSNLVPDVRIGASSLFKTSTSSTSVGLPFSLKPDFQNTAFVLEFELAVPFTGSGVLRVLEAGPDAVAELYQIVKTGRTTTKVSIGRYRMPFQLTVVEH